VADPQAGQRGSVLQGRERHSRSGAGTQQGVVRLVDQGWTQGTSARNAAGNIVGLVDPAAESFCLLGATARAAANLRVRTQEDFPKLEQVDKDAHEAARRAIRDVAGTTMLAQYNDEEHRTQSEVSALLRKAAASVDVAA
jgi:hypothetical protein